MSHPESVRAGVPASEPDVVFCRDSTGRSLLDAAARAVARLGCDDLDHAPVAGRRAGVPEKSRREAVTRDAGNQAVPAEVAAHTDVEAVAAWITRQYPASAYPAVVLGSPHGAAVHLAAALGAPWLPTGFTVTVAWPEGSVGDWPGALQRGAVIADRLLAANPTVTVRQVHDPVQRGALCGSTLTLHVRWRRLPSAYRSFLRRRLRPGGASVLLRDVRVWPVRDFSPGYSFQVGSPASGWTPTDYTADHPPFRRLLQGIGSERWADPHAGAPPRYAETGGDPRLEPHLRELAADAGHRTHRVLYAEPETLSACVADLYRDWYRAQGWGGDRCVVETGRLLDPWRVLAAGAVPYWCESASRQAAAAAEQWLAGSAGFDAVTVLPQPPGTRCDAHADRAQWPAMAAFARRRSHVDSQAMARYPLLPLPTSHAARLLDAQIPPLKPPPATMPMDEAISNLAGSGPRLGMMVV
jgi:hypothetical protein